MSTTTTTPPQSAGDDNNTHAIRQADYIRFKHYAAWTFVVASPILIALPPRKLDHYTALLAGAFVASANHLTREHTGRSILEHIQGRFARPSSSSSSSSSSSFFQELPSERALEIQAKLRAARDAQIRDGTVTGEELERLKRRQQQEKSLAERIWMGGETDGWKERRLREERKALEEGKGYGDLILEHIWDVWNWGKTDSKKEGDSKDEK